MSNRAPLVHLHLKRVLSLAISGHCGHVCPYRHQKHKNFHVFFYVELRYLNVLIRKFGILLPKWVVIDTVEEESVFQILCRHAVLFKCWVW